MQRIVIFLGCILIATACSAQLRNVTFKLAPNYPFIGSVAKEARSIPQDPASSYYVQWSSTEKVRETYETKLGFDFSTGFDAFQFGKFYIHTGVGIQLLRFRRNIEIFDTADPLSAISLGTISYTGYPFGTIFGTTETRNPDGTLLVDPGSGIPTTNAELLKPDPRVGQTTSLYLQLPVMVGRTFFQEKLRMQVGVVPSVLLHSSHYEQKYTFDNAGIVTTIEKKKTRDGYTRVLLNGSFETSYRVAKNFGINLGYQRSFSPIFEAGGRMAGKTFFNSVSLGMSYTISN